MTRRVQWALLALAASAGIALAGTWWHLSYERVARQVDLPPRGEAAYNPLYALKLALRAQGLRAESRQRLDRAAMALAADDTVVLLGDANTVSAAEVDGLLAWVRRGGQLLVPMPGQTLGTDAADGASLHARLGVRRADTGGCVALRDAAAAPPARNGSAARAQPSDRDTIATPGVERHFCGAPRIRLQAGRVPTLRMDDGRGGAVLVRLAEGRGAVSVAADLDFLTNAQLDDPVAGRLAWLALRPGTGTVHLVYRAQMLPLWQLVLLHGWAVWIPILLAVLGGLWAAAQRVGPRLPPLQVARRSLLEHLQAAGEHAVRYRRGHLLHAQVRSAFDAQLRRRDPYAAALSGDARIEAIAARAGMQPTEVRAALQAPRPFDAADLRQRILQLTRLRHRL
jgi:hypothetical protein